MSAAAVLDAAYAWLAERADTDDRGEALMRVVAMSAGAKLDDAPTGRRANLDRDLRLADDDEWEVVGEFTLEQMAIRLGVA